MGGDGAQGYADRFRIERRLILEGEDYAPHLIFMYRVCIYIYTNIRYRDRLNPNPRPELHE
jgi:hypothetical protein